MRLLFNICIICYCFLIAGFSLNNTYEPIKTTYISITKEISFVEPRVNNPMPIIVPYKEVTKNKLKKVSSVNLNTEVKCLALNIYHEARGSSYKDQVAVASTTLNRVENLRWSSNICDVVYEPWAFSWTMDKLSDVPKEKDSWEQSVYIAENILRKRISKVTKATHYYNPKYANPKWAIGEKYEKIGAHKYLTI